MLFRCELCNTFCTSQKALDLHMLSAVHKANKKEDTARKEREAREARKKANTDDSAHTTRSSSRIATKKPTKQHEKDIKTIPVEKKESSKSDQGVKSKQMIATDKQYILEVKTISSKSKEQVEKKSDTKTAPKETPKPKLPKNDQSKAEAALKADEQDLDEDLMVKDEYTLDTDDEHEDEACPGDFDMVVIDDSSDSSHAAEIKIMETPANIDENSDKTTANKKAANKSPTKESEDESMNDAVSILKLLVDEVNKSNDPEDENMRKRSRIPNESSEDCEVKKAKLNESFMSDEQTEPLVSDNEKLENEDTASICQNDEDLLPDDDKVDEEPQIADKAIEDDTKNDVRAADGAKKGKDDDEFSFKIVDVRSIAEEECGSEGEGEGDGDGDEDMADLMDGDWEVKDELDEDECVVVERKNSEPEKAASHETKKEEASVKAVVEVETEAEAVEEKENVKLAEATEMKIKRFCGPKSVLNKLKEEFAQQTKSLPLKKTSAAVVKEGSSTSKPQTAVRTGNKNSSTQQEPKTEKPKETVEKKGGEPAAKAVRSQEDVKKEAATQLVSHRSADVAAVVNDESFISDIDSVEEETQYISKNDGTEGVSLVFSSEIYSLDLDNVSEDEEAKMTDTVSETSLLDDVSEFSDLPAISDISDVDINEIEKIILDDDEVSPKPTPSEAQCVVARMAKRETTPLSESLRTIAREAKIKPLSVTLKRLDEFTLKSWSGISPAKLVEKSLIIGSKSGAIVAKNRIMEPGSKIESVKKAWDRIISQKKDLQAHKKKAKSIPEDERQSRWESTSGGAEKVKGKHAASNSAPASVQPIDHDDISKRVLASAIPSAEATSKLVNYRIPKKSLKPKNLSAKKSKLEHKLKEIGKKIFPDDPSGGRRSDKDAKRREGDKDTRDRDRSKKDGDKDKVRKESGKDAKVIDKDMREDEKSKKKSDKDKETRPAEKSRRDAEKDKKDVDERRSAKRKSSHDEQDSKDPKRSREKKSVGDREQQHKPGSGSGSGSTRSDKLPIKYLYQHSKPMSNNLIVVANEKPKHAAWNKSKDSDMRMRQNRNLVQQRKPFVKKKEVSPIDYFSDYWKVSKPAESAYNRRRDNDSRAPIPIDHENKRDDAQSRVYKTNDGGYWQRGPAAEGQMSAGLQGALMRPTNVQQGPVPGPRGGSNWGASQQEAGNLSKSAMEAKTSLEDLLACLLTIPTLEQIDKNTTENIKRSILGKLSNHLQELKSAQLPSLNINLRPSHAMTLQPSAGGGGAQGLDLEQLNLHPEARNQLQMQLKQQQQQQQLAAKSSSTHDLQLAEYQKQQIAQELAAILTVTGRSEVSEDLLQRLVQQAIATKVTTSFDPPEPRDSAQRPRATSPVRPRAPSPPYERQREIASNFDRSRQMNPTCEATPSYDRPLGVAPWSDRQREVSPAYGRPSHTVTSAYERPTRAESPNFNRPTRVSSPNFNRPTRLSSPNFNRPTRLSSPNFNRPTRLSSPNFNRPTRLSSPSFNRPPRVSSPNFNRPGELSPNFNRARGLSANYNRSMEVSPTYTAPLEISPTYTRPGAVSPAGSYDRPRGFVPNFDRRREFASDAYAAGQSRSPFHSDNDSLYDADSNNQPDVVSPANNFYGQQRGEYGNRNFASVAQGTAYNRPAWGGERVNLMPNVNPSLANFEMNVSQAQQAGSSQDRLKWPYHHPF